MEELRSEFLFEMRVEVHPYVPTGATAAGERRIVNIRGGRFEGPRLRGEVMASGADWIRAEPGGRLRLDVRAALRTDDGAVIYLQYQGVRHGPAEVIRRLDAGEAVDPSEYYFRTLLTFETGDPRYDWLNGTVAVGVGRRLPEGPVYRVHAIL